MEVNNLIKIEEIKNPAIFIVGCGGTGGFTATNLFRLLAGTDVPIRLYDGDEVEPKNLKRQQFSLDDVGRNKAIALAETARATILDASPTSVDENYLTSSDEFLVDILANTPENGVPIIISAVDNVATRKLINEAIEMLPEYVAIDSGNNDQGGQVVFTTNLQATYSKDAFTQPQEIILANMFDVYPELNHIEDKNPGIDQSCDEVVESEPQAMMANSRNGDIIANIVMSVIAGKELAGNVYESSLNGFTTRVRTVER